jgi:ATP:ADP antiporter, AAA family
MFSKINLNFILFTCILTCLSLNNKLLKIVKEALIFTLPDGGTELIPFLKMWIVIPFSIGLLALVSWLKHRLSLYSLFQISSACFLIFYLIFIFVLYPHRDDWLIAAPSASWLPHSFTLMMKHWALSIFYVIGDMWSTVFISVLFWNIAALVFSLGQAKRYYPFFSLDIGGICVGLVGLLSLESIEGIVTLVIGVGLLQIILIVLVKKNHIIPKIITNKVLTKSIERSWKTPFILILGVMIFSYEFSDSFLDLMWKWKVSELYSTPESYSKYMSQVVVGIGILGTLVCLCVARPLAKYVQWRTLALISPILAALSAGGFLICIFYQYSIETTVFLGLIMSCCMQITKYTFFDNSKELALIVQSEQERFNAKIFADGLMTRCGKSSASFLQQILLVLILNVGGTFPVYGGACVLIALLAWLYATFRLTPYVENQYAHPASH